MIVIEQVSPRLVNEFKAVRLRALADTPTAFGSSFAKESQLTDADWLKRSTTWSSDKSATWIALDEGTPCGIIAGKFDDEIAQRAHVLSMWVAPTHRRTGLATTLLDRVQAWAAASGANELRLMVTSKNDPAIHLYQKYGFTRTGYTEPYPNDPALLEYEMLKHLA
jgi:ribosomal protein S18 acetylase RimI-like enzyme